MDAAALSTISALGGATIGGLTFGLTLMLNQRSQARAEKIAHGLARRQGLVRDFIVEASKTYGDALVNSEPKMQELVNLYAMVSHADARDAADGRMRREAHARDRRDLFGAEQDDPRSACPDEERVGRRSPQGVQRSRARRAGGGVDVLMTKERSLLARKRPCSTACG